MIPLRDDTPPGKPPIVTTTVLVACATVFAFATAPAHLGLVPRRIWSPEAWSALGADQLLPLLGHPFVHADWLHLLGNLWCLYLFGSKVEARLGHGRFAALYGLAAVGAATAHLLMRPGSLQPMVGASGPLAGVLAAYMLLFPRAKVLVLLPLPMLFTVQVPALLLLGAWALLQFLLATAMIGETGVAWWAHVGGLVTGLCAAFVLAGTSNRRQPTRLTSFR